MSKILGFKVDSDTLDEYNSVSNLISSKVAEATAYLRLPSATLTGVLSTASSVQTNANALLNEDVYSYFDLFDFETDNKEKFLEDYAITIVNGHPLYTGTGDTLTSIRSLAGLTSYSEALSFLGEASGSYKYLAYSGTTNLGENVRLPTVDTDLVYLDFFWLGYINTNIGIIKQLEAKNLTSQHISKALAGRKDSPASIYGGESAINTTLISDPDIITSIKDAYALNDSDIEELIQNRSVEDVNTDNSSEALNYIRTVIASDVAVIGDYTSYQSPTLVVLDSMDLTALDFDNYLNEVIAEFDKDSLSDSDSDTIGYSLGVLNKCWDATINLSTSYKNIGEQIDALSSFLSWYLNTLGYGSYDNSPLNDTTKELSSDEYTANLSSLLLDDTLTDGLVEEFGNTINRGIRAIMLGINKALVAFDYLIKEIVDISTRNSTLSTFLDTWLSNIRLVRFLFSSAKRSLQLMDSTVGTYFPRLYDNFMASNKR